MSPEIAIAVITAAVALGGSWGVARQAASRQLLDLLAVERARIATLEAQVADLEAKREADARIKRAQGDYIDALQHHIYQRLPPPPPSPPSET